MLQWLRLCILNEEGPGLIPGQGTRIHMLQLRVRVCYLKTLHAKTKKYPEDPTYQN